MAPLWVVLKDIIPEQPRRSARRRSGTTRTSGRLSRGGLHHHRPGGIAARAGAGEPAASRQVAHHPIALRGPATHPAGRDRAAAPPCGVGHPLHPRRRGRLHPGRRREDHHGAGRLRATPFWTIHDHGNTSKKSMVWLDVWTCRPSTSSRRAFTSTSKRRSRTPSAITRRRDALHGSGVLRDGPTAPRRITDHQLPVYPDAADPRSPRQAATSTPATARVSATP